MNNDIRDVKVKGSCKKVAFANEKYALLFIDKLKSTSTRSKVPQSAYLCPKCFLWHLTSQPYKDEMKVNSYENVIKKHEATINKQLDKIKKLEDILAMKENEIRNKKRKLEILQGRYFDLMKLKGLK